jgi:IclR family KDG regulon transcriptional repressor
MPLLQSVSPQVSRSGWQLVEALVEASRSRRVTLSDRSRYNIRSVQRALDLLGEFSVSEPELALNELSSRLDLSVSTTYRLLVTLEGNGYVERNPKTGRYRLGVACLVLGTLCSGQFNFEERVLPILVTLRDECRETVHLGVLDRAAMEVVYVGKLDALLPIGTMGSKVGARVRADCTALGKCMLAHVPPPVVREFYTTHGLRPLTANTITDVDRLMGVLAETKAKGYGIDNVEHEPGVKCVAAPVWNHENKVIGAISVSGPADRIGRLIAENHLIDSVKKTAREASQAMGHQLRAEQDVPEQEATG